MTNVLILRYNRTNFEIMSKENLLGEYNATLEWAKKHVDIATNPLTTAGPLSPQETAAHLSVAGELLIVASKMIGNPLHHTLFESNSNDALVLTGVTDQAENDNKPKTFEDLLLQKIDNHCFKPDEKEITINRLSEMLTKDDSGYRIPGSLPILKKLGQEKQTLQRKEAVDIINALLTGNEGKSLSLAKQANKTELMRFFRITAEQLNKWAAEIEYRWIKNEPVDKKTMSAIHGLAALDRLTNPNK